MVKIDSFLKNIKTVRLDVQGDFPEGFNFSEEFWHIPTRMSQIFEYFGLDLQDEEKSVDAVFKIGIDGNPLSRMYTRKCLQFHLQKQKSLMESAKVCRNEFNCVLDRIFYPNS